MMSEVCKIDGVSLARAAQVVKDGGLVVLPTDTVYGIACSPYSEAAIARIYQAKRRPLTKPLQILLAGVGDLDALGLRLPSPLDVLAEAFLPGPFSPIAEAKGGCTLATLSDGGGNSGTKTQGVRVPDFEPCLETLRATGPLACSSANRSGQESAQSVREALAAFGDDVDLYLDGGPTGGTVASTVVMADASERDGITITREGKISEAEVRAALRQGDTSGRGARA